MMIITASLLLTASVACFQTAGIESCISELLAPHQMHPDYHELPSTHVIILHSNEVLIRELRSMPHERKCVHEVKAALRNLH